MRWYLLAPLLTLVAGAAFAQPVEVEAEATGLSREVAVARALASAVQQVSGVAIQAEILAAQTASQTATAEGSQLQLSAQLRSAIQQQGGGIVRSYRILQVDREDTGGFLARVWVEVERFQPTAPTGETRRRLIVSEFRDEAGRQTQFGQALRDRLLQHLTQSRRFAILDRDANAAYDREMALLMRDAPLTERVRIGQVLGADYVVVGRMRGVGATRREQHIGLTGETVVQTAARGTLDFQVLEIATRQVRWAASVAVANGGDLGGVLDAMAVRIGREITQTIYPLRIVRAVSPTEIIINQGGVTVTQGQRFRAMAIGEELVDPYSRESLGQVEQQLGIVEITRVDPRVSYARLVTGRMPDEGQEVVLRPVPPAPPPRAARPAGPQPSRSMFD